MTMQVKSVHGFPRLSLQERDRRYRAIRERMKKRGVACILIRSDSSKWDAGSAEGRYLSHIGGNGEDGYVILDLHEEPVFVIWGPDHISNWLEIQDWTKDIRPMKPSAAKAVANRVRELGLEKASVGLIGRLGSRLWRGEGRWPQGNYESLRKELPEATFVDFDEELWAEMAVKSDEEIACIERAMEIVESGLEALFEHARPGVPIPELAGKVYGAVVGAGSDLGVQLMLAAGQPTPRVAARIFPHRKLERGDLIINEITGKYCGYCAQAHIPISVGQPPKPEYRRIFDATQEALQVAAKTLKPGITTIDLADAVRRPVAERGYDANAMPLFKGMGSTIAEFPYSPHGVGLDASGKASSHLIRENMVLLFEPAAYDEKLKAGVHIAQQMVVTRDGCRRIGKHELDFKITQG